MVPVDSGVLANDSDLDGDTLIATVATNPTHGTLALNANGSFTYTPAGNYNGADSFTYTASDGHGGSATATVSLTIAAVNDPPVATNDSYSTTRNTTLSVNAAAGVLANDTDVDGDVLTVSSFDASSVRGGTVVVNTNGGFTYTPPSGYTGADSFTYTASDGTATASATVAITINAAVNTPPVATADTYNATEDTPLVVNA